MTLLVPKKNLEQLFQLLYALARLLFDALFLSSDSKATTLFTVSFLLTLLFKILLERKGCYVEGNINLALPYSYYPLALDNIFISVLLLQQLFLFLFFINFSLLYLEILYNLYYFYFKNVFSCFCIVCTILLSKVKLLTTQPIRRHKL